MPAAVAPTPLSWVVGRGGLLGQSLEAALRSDSLTRMSFPGSARFSEAGNGPPDTIWRPPRPVDWSAPDAGAGEVRQRAGEFLAAAGDRPWSVAWCAGAGVTGTSAQALEQELGALGELLGALSAAPHGPRGAFFFASSAGGVYAGVGAPPYDESSPVRPLAPYGQAKLEGEALVAAWSQDSGTPSLIGRIANVYGPGQNLDKAQGLISQICRSHLTGQPLSIYVSLDTLRDYLFAPDCARLIAAGMARLRQDRREPTVTEVGSAPKNSVTKNSVTKNSVTKNSVTKNSVTKILASQRAITIGAVLGEFRRIFKSQPRIVLGASPVSAMQARDLSLRSLVWPELDRTALTPLPVGVATTAADLLRRLQLGAVGTVGRL